jgi:aspartokinase
VFENSEAWVVLKFGGTSVSSAANWHNIAGVLRSRMAANLRPAVVHSAMSGVTDRLESLLVSGHCRRPPCGIGSDRTRSSRSRAPVIHRSGEQFDGFIDELKRMADAIAERPGR